MRNRLLVVDDEPQCNEILYRALREEDYTVHLTGHGRGVTKLAAKLCSDLVIVRWQEPTSDAAEICGRIRASGNVVPILVLAMGGAARRQIRCLESGADDYIGSPCHLELILARIRALLRRVTLMRTHAQVGPLILDRLNHRATLDGHSLQLSPPEYHLLDCLMARTGRTASRIELAREIHSKVGGNQSSNGVELLVATLRKKLRRHANLIETVTGFGYRVDGSPQARLTNEGVIPTNAPTKNPRA